MPFAHKFVPLFLLLIFLSKKVRLLGRWASGERDNITGGNRSRAIQKGMREINKFHNVELHSKHNGLDRLFIYSHSEYYYNKRAGACCWPLYTLDTDKKGGERKIAFTTIKNWTYYLL
jgi:hypothetical protein